MNQKLCLIKKDVIFNYRWFTLFLLCAIMIPLYLNKTALFANQEAAASVSTILSVFVFLERLHSIEGNEETKSFLEFIPVSKKLQTEAKYLLILALVSISTFLSVLAGIITKNPVQLGSLITAGSIAILFFAIFLLMAYKINFQIAQITIVLAVLILYKFSGYVFGCFLGVFGLTSLLLGALLLFYFSEKLAA